MITIIHAIIGYLFLLVTLRLLTRRPGAQMTPFEFVLIFLIGGVIILTTIGDDRSETNSVCAILSVALMHRLVSRLKLMSPTFHKLADGVPLVIISDEKWHSDIADRVRILPDDVMAGAREKGVQSLDQVKYAILERNGGISIIKKQE